MERVYDALKAQIMRGERRPGERLDPARLAAELNASATPVRDALHRLVGERMVQAWPQEGFHAPIHSEPALRDLYAWNLELLLLALRSSARHSGASPPDLPEKGWRYPEADCAVATAQLFGLIASSSPNFEHRQAVAGLNDRLHLARRLEERLFDDLAPELSHIGAAWSAFDRARLRTILAAYHRRRMRQVPDLAALMRPDAASPGV